MRGKLEASTERVERLQNLEPLFGLHCRRFVGWQREQRISAGLAAPNPASQLIELPKAEHIRAVDDQRVCARNIKAGFNDGGR